MAESPNNSKIPSLVNPNALRKIEIDVVLFLSIETLTKSVDDPVTL